MNIMTGQAGYDHRAIELGTPATEKERVLMLLFESSAKYVSKHERSSMCAVGPYVEQTMLLSGSQVVIFHTQETLIGQILPVRFRKKKTLFPTL